jgi:linoleate 10R-lipoxygenase
MKEEAQTEGSSSKAGNDYAARPKFVETAPKHIHEVHPIKERPVEPPSAEASAEQGGAIGSFKKLSDVVHKAVRPLPTETGDGTYVEDESKGGSLWETLRSLGIEDAITVKDFLKNEALGRPVDDKTMLMERIIQVIQPV